MSRESRRPTPAVVIAFLALFVALGGSVYAAKGKHGKRINGHALRVKSLPGNRLAVGSVPGNRLKPGAIPGSRIEAGSITGNQIDAATLGKVPSAGHADTADSARDAGTALIAVSANDAKTVNGHSAGCGAGTRYFAGACWQEANSGTALSAPAAALACASQGGELPEALALAAFSQQAGITLATGDEWSGDIPTISGSDVYGVATVSASAKVDFTASTNQRKFRCVIPLVS